MDVRHRRCSGARPPFLLRAAASPARWPSPRGRGGGERGATSGANSLAENSWSPLRHAPVASAHPWLSCAAAVIGVSPGSLSSPRAAGKHRRGTRSIATLLFGRVKLHFRNPISNSGRARGVKRLALTVRHATSRHRFGVAPLYRLIKLRSGKDREQTIHGNAVSLDCFTMRSMLIHLWYLFMLLLLLFCACNVRMETPLLARDRLTVRGPLAAWPPPKVQCLSCFA